MNWNPFSKTQVCTQVCIYKNPDISQKFRGIGNPGRNSQQGFQLIRKMGCVIGVNFIQVQTLPLDNIH